MAKEGGSADRILRRERLARQGTDDIRLGLGPLKAALAALGHPERRLPPVIHVTGTNGKGSTIAFLGAMLEAGGYVVHRFTSPALYGPGEQISLAGRPLTDDTLDRLADEAAAAAPQALTPFETLTLAAILAASRMPADLFLLEVGLGGAGDATNVIERPLLTLVTPIARDHEAFLGMSVAEIAQAEAGLLKPHVAAVIGPQPAEARLAIEAAAAERQVALSRHGTEWFAFGERGRMVYQDETGLIDLPLPALPGRHQIDNAGLAIAALRALGGLALTDRAIETGLVGARWPARLERILEPTLLAQLSEGSDLWLDGGHNPHAGEALAAFMGELNERAPRPLVLVVAMLAGRDAAAFLRPFAGLARRVIAVPLPLDRRGADPGAIQAAARAAGLVADTAGDLAGALAAARLDEPVRVLLCGSFALARLLPARHA